MSKRAEALMVRAKRESVLESPLNDRELLNKYVQDADQTAFACLVARHSAMVLGVCKRVLNSQEDAEDACQAVFLVLARKARGNRWQSSIANWLYSTARNVARNARLAKLRRTKRDEKATSAETVSPLEQVSGKELLSILDEELDKLAPRYREPLVLCYLEGLTRDEAAQRLNVPTVTLKSQLERGRKKLADSLSARGCTLGAVLLAVATIPAVATAAPTFHETILSAVGGAPTPAAAELAREMTMSGTLPKIKLALLAFCAVASIGWITYQPIAAESPKQPEPAKAADPKADPPKADPKSERAKAEPKPTERTITGRVLGLDGKPFKDAKILIPLLKKPIPESEDDIDAKEVCRSDAEGKFSFTYSFTTPLYFAAATADGYGMAFKNFLNEKPVDAPIELQLVEDFGIAGRVVNTEGKPVKGVRVRVFGLRSPKDGMDNMLATWKKDVQAGMNSMSHDMIGKSIPEATTDADGKYKFSGVGKDRVAIVNFSGAGIARQSLWVVTRKGFDPKPYNDLLLKKENEGLRVLNHFLGLHAPEFTHIAEAGRVVEGTVTDADTGKPIADYLLHMRTGYGDGIIAKTDAEGKYRFEGITKDKLGYQVHTGLRKTDYLATTAHAPESEGFTPITLNIKMSRGAVIVGQLVDKKTGKGVRGTVRVAPLENNKFYGKVAGSEGYQRDRTHQSTDEKGHFRLPSIPGQVIVMAQVHGLAEVDGQYVSKYRRAQPDPDHKSLFTHEPGMESWSIKTAGNSMEFLNTEAAVKIVDVNEKGETKAELKVDQGETGKLEIQDTDGKALKGTTVIGLSDGYPYSHKVSGSRTEVFALNPEKPRKVFALHLEKKLAGSALIRGDEKEPVVVKLLPMPTITGKFTHDGAPLANAEITLGAQSQMVAGFYHNFWKTQDKVKTDAEGKFTIPFVIPGEPVYLMTQKGGKFYRPNSTNGSMIMLKSGETKDLGERVLVANE